MALIRLIPIVALVVAGCAREGRRQGPAGGERKVTTSVSPTPAKSAGFSATNNPTTSGGRGAPSLDDAARPAGWVFVDGKAGTYGERDGQKLVEWVIAEPVSSRPILRVEGFEPLLGDAHDFRCVVRSVDSTEGTQFIYGISAKPGTFSIGAAFPLTDPGDNFVIQNGVTKDMVRQIAPLSPGRYAVAASIENARTGKKAAAVTYFTVGTGQ